MQFRRVALLVGIYLALDFANPMMPGSVQLVDGSLRIVAGCQARTTQAPAPLATALPRHLATIAPQPESMYPAACVVFSSPPASAPIRSSFAPRSAPPSSPDDD